MRFVRLMASLCLCLGVVLFAPGAGATEDPQSGDRAAVRLVIESQLAAFSADDADRAFSFAAPSIQKSFVTARNFMDMVRIAYPVVYRPAGVSFQIPIIRNQQAWQTVLMRDAAGMDWTAHYTLTRYAKGVWKIDACLLRPGTDQAV